MLLWPDPRTVPMPLFAELKMVSYNTKIWGTFYNYSHPEYIFKGTCINASENKIYKMADHENA